MDISSFKQALAKVISLHREKKFAEAYELIEQLLLESPYSSNLLVKRAKLIQLLDDELSQPPTLEMAFDSLKQAHSLEPQSIEPCIELGYFEYAVNDQTAEGLKYFQLAQENAETGLKDALVGQIKCYMDMDDKMQAKKVLEKARVLFPDDDDVEDLFYELED